MTEFLKLLQRHPEYAPFVAAYAASDDRTALLAACDRIEEREEHGSDLVELARAVRAALLND